jgi:hypothetical protein
MLVRGWDGVIDKFLEDGVISEDEEVRLNDFLSYFNLKKNDLDELSGNIEKLLKGLVLRDVMNGVIPKRVALSDNFPVNLQGSSRNFVESVFLDYVIVR